MIPPTASSPLTPAQQQEIVEARQRAKKLVSAARVAAFNGWTTGIAAAISVWLLFVFGDIAGLIVTAVLGIVTVNEFRGRKKLLRFEPGSTRVLGLNQLGFMSVLVGYCLWNLFTAWQAPEKYTVILSDPQVQAMLTPEIRIELRDLLVPLIMLLYSIVILLSLMFQGLNAVYYFTRTKYLREYLHKTPAWIIDMQRSGLLR